MLTLITPTRNRPEAFELLQQWMNAQTYRESYQWIVVNDGVEPYRYRMKQEVLNRDVKEGEGPSLHQNLLHAIPHVRGDQVLIIEDDDYYHPDYLTTMAGFLTHFELVGEGRAVYYNVRTRRYQVISNLRHASLAQTGLRAKLLPLLAESCRSGNRFVDAHLWKVCYGYKHIFTGEYLQVGIKGMPGQKGFGDGHGDDEGIPDDELRQFRAWNIPVVYERFYQPAGADARTATGTPGRRDLIAPLGTSDVPNRLGGRCAIKPWNYRATAVIPHLNTPLPLLWVVELLRHQTEPPYIMVIDTGSDEATCLSLEALRAEDLEIHYLKAHAWSHASEPVAVAMDTAFALCRTEFLYCTHADCFLRRPDWLEWLVAHCGAHQPAIGYQMSDRSWINREWEWMVSHTATILHMPTMHRVGAGWSFPKYRAMQAAYQVANPDWIDTEVGFNWSLRWGGVVPLLLGPEYNYERMSDDNIDHVRSYPSATIYKVGPPAFRENRVHWMEMAIREARERVRSWKQHSACRSAPEECTEEEVSIKSPHGSKEK